VAPASPHGIPAAATGHRAPSGERAADPDLLLLRSGELSAGFPWQKVAGIELSEEAEAGAPAISMHAILEGGNGRSVADEPYRINWKSQDGAGALTCEFLAGVVPASSAASRGVELVLEPVETSPEAACRVITLLDYLTGEPERAPEEPAPEFAANAPEPAAEAVEAVQVEAVQVEAVQVEAEAPTARVELLPPSITMPAATPPVVPPSVPPYVPTLVASAAPPALPAMPDMASYPAAAVITPRIGPDEFPRGPALVAVRYLPARVAIARVLRSLGFFAAEAPDNQELPTLLSRGSYSVVFAEPPDPVDPSWQEALKRAHESGIAVAVVTSRLRARARDPLRLLQDAPRLYHPFREGEIERTLGTLRASERSR
jgi:hypothetical protein